MIVSETEKRLSGDDKSHRTPGIHLMTDQEIKASYERDGYVVVRDIIDDGDLDPLRTFIQTRVDAYAREQVAQGKLSSLYEDESFERRYAAICEEQELSPRGWSFGSFGREFYDLCTLPGILHVLSFILGPEVANLGSPALRTKLPGSVITSFPWHQDSQYVDQSTVGKKEKHTERLHLVTVWVPLVEATVENGCCWVMPGSHRWGLLDGARGEEQVVVIGRAAGKEAQAPDDVRNLEAQTIDVEVVGSDDVACAHHDMSQAARRAQGCLCLLYTSDAADE